MLLCLHHIWDVILPVDEPIFFKMGKNHLPGKFWNHGEVMLGAGEISKNQNHATLDVLILCVND